MLGIFSLDDKGAQGAVLQMLNHGLVVVPLFLVIGAIAARARGSESLSELGGMAMRAPGAGGAVPDHHLRHAGDARLGELRGRAARPVRHLRGRTSSYGMVASAGVVLAAVYMIRVFQRTMHNRVGRAVESREICRGWSWPRSRRSWR